MAAALLRPELPVIARTVSPAIAERMQAFGTPTVVNPFDRFGDHLRLALRAPASYQLMTWLESGPGAALPPAAPPPTHGRWVMCGYGRFGRELAADLRAEGLRGHGRRARPPTAEPRTTPTSIVGDGVRAGGAGAGRPRPAPSASSPAPTTTPPTSRWSPPPAGPTRSCSSRPGRTGRPARRCSPPMDVDSLLVPDRGGRARGLRPAGHAAAVAVPAGDAARSGDAWAAAVVDRLTALCGEQLQACGRCG